jgi:uncharacterized HAD superfamily protein
MKNFKIKKRGVIMVDVDGTLTLNRNGGWTEKDCLNAKPNKKVIAKINELFNKHTILIYTARPENLMEATLVWLRMHKVKFHGWATGKKPADLYIDDKTIRPDEL